MVDSNLDPVSGFVRIYSRSVIVYKTETQVQKNFSFQEVTTKYSASNWISLRTKQGREQEHSIFQQSNRYRAAVKAVDGAGLLSPTSNFASIFIEQRPLRTHCPRCKNFKIFLIFFFREFHHVASDNCLLFKEQVNMILNSFPIY